MTAYYNEHNEYAAAWLRNLIGAGHIAPAWAITSKGRAAMAEAANGRKAS
jgi:hypothetical protein